MLIKNKKQRINDSALEPTMNVEHNSNQNKPKKKINKRQILDIVFAVLVVFAHIAIGLVVYNSFRYYAIYPSLFGSIVGVVVCLLAIIDIVFFVGFNHKDLALKIISVVLALFLTIGGTVGTVLLNNVNKTVDNVLYDGSDVYEKVSGVFVNNIHSDYLFNDLNDVKGRTVGVVTESEVGVATIGKKKLESVVSDYGLVEYNTMMDLVMALIDNKVDVAILSSGYRAILEKDENADYSSILAELNDFYSFEEEVKVNTKVSNKDISIEPFNVLLIGWSRTDIGSTVGLADAIIIATVNPKTYTVSMTSIARDSYVPIPCYGGTKDKINSGRSTSRACFIETVEELVGEEMDFYIEADYQAIVNIVNALGGIKINNPVDFTLDGIYVAAGYYTADGQQVLQFCRERHHMPNGDFDRQQHQKEVILEVVKTLLNKGDLAVALNVLNAAGEYMTTNLTLKQLTNMFNMILNTKNYTGLKTFDLLDFQQSRMTGYASWYYNYGMQLPLWIYKLYNGSLKESIDHMEYVLGNNTDMSDQVYTMEFSSKYPYDRPLFFSLNYDEKEEHEEMPPYYIDMTGMSEEEAVAWAKQNGVKLKIEYITPGSADYNPEKNGKVISQSVYYGRLIANNPNCTIVVMGEDNSIPSFEGMTIEEAKKWAKEKGYTFEAYPGDPADSKEYIGIIYAQKFKEETETLRVWYYGKPVKVNVSSEDTKKGSVNSISGTYSADTELELSATPNEGYTFDGWYIGKERISKNSEFTYTIPDSDVSIVARFTEKKECNHNWVYTGTTATCTSDGVNYYECSECGETKEEAQVALGHDFTDTTCPTCSRCSEPNPYYVPPVDPPINPEPGDEEEENQD